MALAQVIGNKSEAAYRRGDMLKKRQRLMYEWATFCTNDGAVDTTVTPIRKTINSQMA